MQFSAGVLSNSVGLLIACHLEYCELCRGKCAQYEALGGALLQKSASVNVSDDLLVGLMNRLDQSVDTSESTAQIVTPVPRNAKNTNEIDKVNGLPRPLWRWMGQTLDSIPWRGYFKHVKQYYVPISDDDSVARLYKITAGCTLPKHTHSGHEYTVVVSGSFSDEAGTYHQGDCIIANQDTMHQPTASDHEDCICFAVMDAPIKLMGVKGFLFNRFIER